MTDLNNFKQAEPNLAAGGFSSWLRDIRKALLDESGMDVPCGECIGCCSSYQFIQVGPEETGTLARIRKDLLVAAPGLPTGHALMGYDKKGFCPMMVKGKCSIYEQRPLTCLNYDCRIFPAAGITPRDKDKARIAERVRRWKFSYPAKQDRAEHAAVQAAATFIQEHAECFPGTRIPSDPGQLAVLAVKAYQVFLNKNGDPAETVGPDADAETAAAIVKACRKFDAGMSSCAGT